MKQKVALIFGVTGQDGSYLARFLLSKNYIVHGIKRRASSLNTTRIDDIYVDPHIKSNNFFYIMEIYLILFAVLKNIQLIKPDEIYNLINYREAYKIFACNGILFNHESPIRGETFVTKKIVKGLCDILNNKSKKLYIRKSLCKKRLGTCKRLCLCNVENVTNEKNPKIM